MKLSYPTVPKELDADVAMCVIIPHAESMVGKNLSYSYEFQGVSERTALGDELNFEIKNKQNRTSTIRFFLKRDSLYHILPEYLFHSLDHYLGTEGDTEEFDKRYKEQEEQKNNALAYFKPFDQHYQQLRTNYQQWLNEHIFGGNQFLADFITDGYKVNLSNPYIKAIYSCLPWLKEFRGNEDLIRVALGYAFKGQAKIQKEEKEQKVAFSENISSRLEGLLDDLYCGSTFNSGIRVWKIFFQTKIGTAKNLQVLKEQISEFSEFFSLWFLPIESKIEIKFGDKFAVPQLSEVEKEEGVFLNYSTQLI